MMMQYKSRGGGETKEEGWAREASGLSREVEEENGFEV